MKITPLLSGADEQRLRAIVTGSLSGPPATPDQKKILRAIIKRSEAPSIESELESWVGLEDRVSLVSPTDSRDYYNLHVVMPKEENVDEDRISILRPVSLAVLGRRCGETVTWEAPGGKRQMRIIAIEKAESRIHA